MAARYATSTFVITLASGASHLVIAGAHRDSTHEAVTSRRGRPSERGLRRGLVAADQVGGAAPTRVLTVGMGVRRPARFPTWPVRGQPLITSRAATVAIHATAASAASAPAHSRAVRQRLTRRRRPLRSPGCSSMVLPNLPGDSAAFARA
jgi:hypothetical protein